MTAPVGMLNIPKQCERRVLELHAFCTQCKPKLLGRISWSKRDSYLSLFLVMSEGSTPSMRFLKHCAMSSCFSKGCIAITFRCNSWKYWKNDNKLLLSDSSTTIVSSKSSYTITTLELMVFIFTQFFYLIIDRYCTEKLHTHHSWQWKGSKRRPILWDALHCNAS